MGLTKINFYMYLLTLNINYGKILQKKWSLTK